MLFQNISVIIGQILGIAVIIMGFVTFQMKTSKALLIMQIAVCATFCAHYALISAASAFALNAIGLVRNIVYYNRDKFFFGSKYCPWLFATVMVIAGAFSWEGWYSLLTIFGLGINTVCMSFKNPQNIRKSILITSPLVLIYDIIVMSVGGTVYETVAIISALLGIIRFHKQQTWAHNLPKTKR